MWKRLFYQLQTAEKQKDDVTSTLFPSLPKAPKLRKKTPLEHLPGLRIGFEIERYDPKKHNK